MNEVMAEVVQLSSWKTKAINLRAAASSRASPLCKDTEDELLCLPHTSIVFTTCWVKTGRGFFTVRADAAKGKREPSLKLLESGRVTASCRSSEGTNLI